MNLFYWRTPRRALVSPRIGPRLRDRLLPTSGGCASGLADRHSTRRCGGGAEKRKDGGRHRQSVSGQASRERLLERR